MELLRNFKELSKSDVGLAGGKGASLGEMTQAGIPVPPGFVVLSASFEKFIEETGLSAEIDAILDSVNHEEIHTVENASEKIRALILAAAMPKDIAREINASFKKLGAKYVAVRSSATAEDSASAAWAGQLDSFLNTPSAKVLENVKRCWASLFTPRAIFYRFEKGLHAQKISVAVVVQKMVESEISGIAFSVHPVTQDRNQLIIEASYGLGEAIVSGQVTPDSYIVEKTPRNIIERTVQAKTRGLYRSPKAENEWKEIVAAKAEAQALSDKQILELSELILRIEKHYGFPCDIEWAFEKGKFYIVQSRPITTLGDEKPATAKYSKIFTRDFCLPAIEVWYRGESINEKHWIAEKQPRYPYIVFERREGTDDCYYDLEGVEWIKQKLLEQAKSDKEFIPMLVRMISKQLKSVQPIYEGKKAISRKALIHFLAELEDYYPWFEAMWWFMEMTDEELHGLKIDRLRELRKETNDLSTGTDMVIRKSLAKLYPVLKEYSAMLSTKEIVSGKLPSIAELKKRDAGFFFTDDKVYVGAIREEIENKYNLELERVEVSNNIVEIKGQSAFPGIIKGRVRRVMGHKDIDVIKKGEILVSPMTMPDFLPAMQKAAAFITDEGGIMCHAAIVARELKKPCIVGTKIATQFLKDGDMVEVDANKGIVKIVN